MVAWPGPAAPLSLENGLCALTALHQSLSSSTGAEEQTKLLNEMLPGMEFTHRAQAKFNPDVLGVIFLSPLQFLFGGSGHSYFFLKVVKQLVE